MTRDELIKELKRYGDEIINRNLFVCHACLNIRYNTKVWSDNLDDLATALSPVDKITAIYAETEDGLEKLEPKKELTDEEWVANKLYAFSIQDLPRHVQLKFFVGLIKRARGEK